MEQSFTSKLLFNKCRKYTFFSFVLFVDQFWISFLFCVACVSKTFNLVTATKVTKHLLFPLKKKSSICTAMWYSFRRCLGQRWAIWIREICLAVISCMLREHQATVCDGWSWESWRGCGQEAMFLWHDVEMPSLGLFCSQMIIQLSF